MFPNLFWNMCNEDLIKNLFIAIVIKFNFFINFVVKC